MLWQIRENKSVSVASNKLIPSLGHMKRLQGYLSVYHRTGLWHTNGRNSVDFQNLTNSVSKEWGAAAVTLVQLLTEAQSTQATEPAAAARPFSSLISKCSLLLLVSQWNVHKKTLRLSGCKNTCCCFICLTTYRSEKSHRGAKSFHYLHS